MTKKIYKQLAKIKQVGKLKSNTGSPSQTGCS